MAAVTVCSTSFAAFGGAQARSLGYSGLPIAVVPHPFGILSRAEIKQVADKCVDDISRMMCAPVPEDWSAVLDGPGSAKQLIEAPDDLEEVNRFLLAQRWGDGLPLIPPTPERLGRMLRHTKRAPDEVIAKIAPAFGEATVERIAVNAVLAGCYPEYLPVLIAATEAVTEPTFNLQGVQSTTNPVAVWLVINGPIARQLGVNSSAGCLGPGTWSNATLGRALRLILQNIGGARPGEMDQASHGQPAKYTFCCAENEEANPWEPFHVELGYAPERSTVTVVAALGILNLNTHSKDADIVLRLITESMAYPMGNDYIHCGTPWLVLGPEHADVLKRAGLSKADVKRRLWEGSKIVAGRLSPTDCERVRIGRRAELGEIEKDTLIPITRRPEDIKFIVAGDAGTHSVFIPGSRSNCSTREVMF